MPIRATAAAFVFCLAAGVARAQPPSLQVTLADAPQIVFSQRQACDGDDTPDVNARAFRDSGGQTVVFALHDLNRALRGPDLAHLKIDCATPYRGHHNPDPAAYDDNAWIAAIWTVDGRNVVALAHHEYHASEHPGRCISTNFMACWYNTIIALHSDDGGAHFSKDRDPVVASSPFRQSVDQTRHRGFFNPSNIFKYHGAWYFFASTTGWPGQAYGACLFRSATPANSRSWRAYDGHGFTIRYHDPYGSKAPMPKPCAIISPFRVPVGSVTRYRPTGDYLAIWQVQGNERDLPVSGFYYATSRNLLRWSDPRLLIAGKTLYDNPCDSGGRLINYPSILDPGAHSRIYDDTGARPWLFYATLQVKGCTVTSSRLLWRQALRIVPLGADHEGMQK